MSLVLAVPHQSIVRVQEGRSHRVPDFSKRCDAMKRKPQDVFHFMAAEFGSSVRAEQSSEGVSLVIEAPYTEEDVRKAWNTYVERYSPMLLLLSPAEDRSRLGSFLRTQEENEEHALSLFLVQLSQYIQCRSLIEERWPLMVKKCTKWLYTCPLPLLSCYRYLYCENCGSDHTRQLESRLEDIPRVYICCTQVWT